MNDDTRFEMAMAAAGRERRNRPVVLVVLAAGALLLSGVAALAGLVSRAAATGEYQDQLDTASRTDALLMQFKQLQQSALTGEERSAHEPIPLIITRMGDAAVRAGLTQPIPQGESATERAGVTIKEYRYTGIRADSLKPLLEWVRLAVEDVPGLELYQIPSLNPEPNGWTMSVTFRRWERKG
jgi:hypothetical protein